MSTSRLAALADIGPAVETITEVRRKEALLKTGALQNAILNSANFSIIATDEKGVIQLFNIGAETMLGYAAVEVINKIGWPDRINRYRVDFRLPNSVKPGEPQVVISAGPNTGLPTPILVR